MALVSISKAAQLAGINWTTLYESSINKGLLSISKDIQGKPKIDTSELLRVFGVLQETNHNRVTQQLLTEPYNR